MSTRAVIARPDLKDPNRWKGVYVHQDGYPTGAGKWLYAHVMNHFGGDPQKAAEFYIDQHPCGWSGLAEAFGQGECYCHDRGEPEAITVETESGAGGMDWTYVLRPEGLEIRRWDWGVVSTVMWTPDNSVDWEAVERAGKVKFT